MYATSLHCFYCGADFPLAHRGSCTVCAAVGQESALNETLGVQYDLAAIKRQLDREELARRPPGLWRYRALLPVVDPAFRVALAVADRDMLAALKDLASYEGIYAEAASAAALAGIRRAVALGLLRQEATRQTGVVGILTSHGLKNSLALTQAFPPPTKVEGTWEALRNHLEGSNSLPTIPRRGRTPGDQT